MDVHERFAFEPIFNLRTSRVVGFEVQPRHERDRIGSRAAGTVWGTRQVVELDAAVALASLAFATDADASVPLHVDVLADTVVASRRRLRGMLDGLAERGRAVPPVVLEVGPPASAAPTAALVDALRELRSWGFRIALDAAGGFGLDVVAAARPDLVKLDPHIVAGLGHSSLASTVAHALVEVAGAAAARVVATGVTEPGQLTALGGLGVTLAQGPLLATPRRRASTSGVTLPVDLALAGVVAGGAVDASPGSDGAAVATRHRPTAVRDLAQAAVTLPDTATADDARRVFADHPHAGGVVLVDPRRVPTCHLDRNRFMLAISGPYGRALYAARPAATLGDRPRVLDEHTPTGEALRAGLSGDPARSYDDVVLVAADGTCTGVVRIADMLRTATVAAA
ncbi:diguanylate phosphodiesterase [Pseudonocardia dioxanivorans CB1190]|uniref:Diguanylate phosphodiesterase n=1 Tax=Pseudonocardia dioxanivorans (strain ATCC 55486 / DSM 44775 / JCM 13855 / CB1190) TaxID=675635 RepID=F4CIY9_PSEUX|nr:EAL domain-containing protein [Pseudonocardia dioxanivorans]AEA23209.1 diguanylate phosphodiesterase [Pseudonocardia dioxanivorans CB1190]